MGGYDGKMALPAIVATRRLVLTAHGCGEVKTDRA